MKVHAKNRYRTNREAKDKLNYQAKPNVLSFCEPCRCANNKNPYKVSCQCLVHRKQDIFTMKTTFISTSWRKQCLTFCNLRPILKTRSTIIHIIIEIFNEYLLIYLFALIVAFAKEFATALSEKPRNAIKVTFGSHIRKLHLDCNQHMIEFAKDARESGIFFFFFHHFISLYLFLLHLYLKHSAKTKFLAT